MTENATCLEAGDPKHVGENRPVRVSLIRDGDNWLVVGVDDLTTCRVKRASINSCPVLVTVFAPTVPQWVLDQNATDQDMLGEGEDVHASEVGADGFNLERELPTEVRIRCRFPGWHDDYEGGPFLISHNAVTFRTPVPRYSEKSFPFRFTWVRDEFGSWKQLERSVRWESLDDPKAPLPDGEAKVLVSLFKRERVPEVEQRGSKKSKTEESKRVVFAVSSQKAKRAVEKEVPYAQTPPHQQQAYDEARAKEWNSWTTYDAATPLTQRESERVRRERGDRVIKSRYVYRDKHAGMTDSQGDPLPQLPLKAKARLCVQGQFDPDCASGEVKVDAPTIQKVTFMTFLHLCASFGWTNSLRAGDVSSAFLQGGESTGEPLYMEQPVEGIPGMERGQLLRLRKPVYGRPDAPRAWFDEFSKVLISELGFEKSCLDPSWFILRVRNHCPIAMLTLHVDDVMIAGDGSSYSESVIDRLHRRFPFGEWSVVAKEGKVRYCGKEVCVEERNGSQCIVLKQKDFVIGKLDPIPLSADRKRQSDSAASGQERTDFRSTIGSLQWLSTQSRPDIAFEVNQLQKRVPDLRVFDLLRANVLVKEVKSSDSVGLVFEDLSKECEIVVFHDAALFNSVGVELETQDADQVLLSLCTPKRVFWLAVSAREALLLRDLRP